MRKLIVAVICFALVSLAVRVDEPIISSDVDIVTLYLDSASSNCERITVSYEQYLNEYLSSGRVFGVCVERVDENFAIDIVERLSARPVFEEKLSGTVTKYYYSTKIPFYKRVNGKKVNLQVAESFGNFTVASPLIFGGF